MIRKLILAMSAAACAFAQPSPASHCSEYFDAATIPAQWTLASSDSYAMVYQGSGSASPGMTSTSQGGVGTAYMPCAVGSQSFTLQADVYQTHNYAYTDYLLGGSVGIALTTSPITSMGSSDVSIFANMNGGPFLGMWLGNLPSNYATTTNLIVGQQLGTSFGPAYTSFNWPQSANELAQIPNWRWTIQIIRDGSNNLTFNMLADNYLKGAAPYYSYTVAIPSAYQSKSFQYVSLYTLGTGAPSSRYDTGALFTSIRVVAGVTGGTPATINGISPASAGGSYQTGNTIDLIGTNFNASASCSVRVGQGSTYQTAAPSYVSATLMTLALPAESNGATYPLHLICNNIDSEYYPGIYYSAPILYSILPFEVPPTPANSADGTVQLAGAGFDSTCTITFAGNSGTVTYNSPTSLSVVVPNGSQGSPAILLKCNSGSTTVYDSTSSGTYPVTGKISFGYSAHPYLQFNAAGLTTIQSRWTNPAYMNYADAVTRAITYDTINGGNSQLPSIAFVDYGYRYLLSNSSSDLTAYSTGVTTANQGAFSNEYPLDTVNFFFSGFPAGLGSAAVDFSEMYDLLFPSLTPTQRAQYETFLQNAINYFYYAKTNDPSGSGSGSGAGASWPNRVAVTQGGGGTCLLALYSSLQSLRGYATPTTYVNTTAQTLLTAIDTQVQSWADYSWMPDGGYVEGILYATYGTTAYDIYARARINLNTLVGNSPVDPGFFTTNYQYAANFVNTMWDGAALTTFNDAQPLVEMVPQMIDLGQRTGNRQLAWMADWIMYLEDAAQQPDSAYCAPYNCVMGGNRWQQNDSYAQYAMMWRSSNPSTTLSGVYFPSPSLLTSTDWGSIKSQTSTATPDFYLGMKGASNHEVGGGQHHENDTCTFTLASRGEQFLLDPGYLLPAAINHNAISVDGNTVGGSDTNVAAFDTTTEVNNGAWQIVPMTCTAAYTTGVTAMRRTFGMYVNGSARFGFVLDDITPSGTGAIIEYLQSLPAVSSASASGFTMKGQRSEIVATFNGPTNTEANATGSPSFCSADSWIYCYMPSVPANYTTVTNSYMAASTTPEVTTFAPASLSGAGAITATVAYGAGTVTITLSDGSTITFGNGSGSWVVTGNTVAHRVAAQ